MTKFSEASTMYTYITIIHMYNLASSSLVYKVEVCSGFHSMKQLPRCPERRWIAAEVQVTVLQGRESWIALPWTLQRSRSAASLSHGVFTSQTM